MRTGRARRRPARAGSRIGAGLTTCPGLATPTRSTSGAHIHLNVYMSPTQPSIADGRAVDVLGLRSHADSVWNTRIERQSGGETQEQHRDHRPLEIDRERLAPSCVRRRFSCHGSAIGCGGSALSCAPASYRDAQPCRSTREPSSTSPCRARRCASARSNSSPVARVRTSSTRDCSTMAKPSRCSGSVMPRH